MKVCNLEEAVSHIKSNDRVYIHSVAAAPQQLIKGMVARKDELRHVEIIHLHTEGEAPYVAEGMQDSFCLKSFFVGPNVRAATQANRADYIPVFLSEVPSLMRKGVLPVNVALIQVAPPDKHGFCSLGISVDATLAAVESADIVIAQINPNMPFTLGDGCIPISKIDYGVEVNDPIPSINPPAMTKEEELIGQHVAGLVEDGATLQMGIGAIPNAVLQSLTNHKNLGIHTEMFSDGVIPLVEKGIITGEAKRVHRGKIVSAFVMGTQKLYDFVNKNPGVMMMDVAHVNDVSVIRKNPKVTAINSAIEIDFTGQVCADSIGTRHYSGVGGQIDFIRGASYSEGGKPIIALPSMTKRGQSKIVPFLKQGAGVVSTRANVHYIATEYGVVNLYGLSLKERAKKLISIAHPDHRETLEKEAFERFGSI